MIGLNFCPVNPWPIYLICRKVLILLHYFIAIKYFFISSIFLIGYFAYLGISFLILSGANMINIHQIELTSRCNLRCQYCAHPTMGRAKQDMPVDVFRRAIRIAGQCVAQGWQNSINLAGIGESTMRDDLVDLLGIARAEVGPSCQIVLATNGVVSSAALAAEFARLNIDVFVSLHRPEKAGKAIEFYRKAGVLRGVSADPSISATDWAGQVDWHVSAQSGRCPWISGNWFFIASTGDVRQCSFDARAEGSLGNIMSPGFDVNLLRGAPYTLCKTCHQIP